MRARLGLVFPRFHYPSGDIPLGLALLASVLRERLPLDVCLHDATWEPGIEAVERFIDREKLDFLGIGASTLMLPDALRIARLASDRGIRVFLGGPHPTVDPAGVMALRSVDAVVVGEGEESTTELLGAWLAGHDGPIAGTWTRDPDGSPRPGPSRDPISDLNQLPLPAWDLLDMPRYLRAWGQLDACSPGLRGINVLAGRGCPFQCTFCQPVLDRLFGSRLRMRGVEGVVREIQALVQRYGIEGYWFCDDTFTANRAWVLDLCGALRRAGLDGLSWGATSRANLVDPELLDALGEVGFRKLGIGLESAVEAVREGVYGKGVSLESVRDATRMAREREMQVLLFLVLGAPGESLGDMLRTIEEAASSGATEASFSLLVPVPGTELHERMLREGRGLSSDWSQYDYYARQPFEHELGAATVRALQRWAYVRFHADPRRWNLLLRGLRHPEGRRSLLRKLRRLAPFLWTPGGA